MFSICAWLRPQHFTLWSCSSEHGLVEHIWDRSVPTGFRFSKTNSPFSLDLDFCVHTAAPPKYCGTATKVPKHQTIGYVYSCLWPCQHFLCTRPYQLFCQYGRASFFPCTAVPRFFPVRPCNLFPCFITMFITIFISMFIE